MSNRIQKMLNRTLAMILAIVIVVGMIPMFAFAQTQSVIETDLHEKDVIVGEYVEFTVKTTANDDLNTAVLGYFDFNGGDWSAIESLQYKESKDGNWYDLAQDTPFGHPATGFPMADATSTFRVKFKTAGTYTFSVSMKTFEEGTELCRLDEEVTVKFIDSVITTDIADKEFVIGNSCEFTFTSTPNNHAGEYVFGKFTFSNWDAVETLEYWGVTENQWMTLPQDTLFGPPATGFPMSQATTKLRVTFNKIGEYTCTVSLVKASNTDEVLSSVEKSVKVVEKIAPVIENVTANTTDWAQSVTISGAVSDEGGSGVKDVMYNTTGNKEDQTSIATLNDNGFEFVAEENATYYIWAVDGHGNVSEVKTIEIANVDTTAPDLSVTINPETLTGKNGVKLNIVVGDTASTAEEIKVYYTVGTDNARTELTQVDGKVTLIVTENGTYKVFAVDAANNEASMSVEVKNIDSDSPVVTTIAANPNSWTNGEVTINGTVSDTGAEIENPGVAKVVYNTTGSYEDPVVEATFDAEQKTFTFTVPSTAEFNGKYYVWAIDSVGNVSAVVEVAVRIDTTAPAVDTITADPNAATNQEVIVSGTVSDKNSETANSGVVKVVYNTTGNFEYLTQEATFNAETGAYSFSVANTAEFNDKYYVWAVDAAGNVSDRAEVSVFIDITAPTVDTITATADVATNQDVTVSGKVSDKNSDTANSGVVKVVYNTTGDFEDDTTEAAFNAGTYTFTISKDAEFNGMYYVWAVDAAGNVSEAAEVSVFIDTTEPTVDDVADIVINRDIAIISTVFDDASDIANSGVVKVVYNTTGTYDEVTEAEFDVVEGRYRINISNETEFDGYYYVWAIDAAGNVSEAREIRVIIDTTDPIAKITTGANMWQTFLEKFTFGIYSKNPLEVTIDAADDGSGVNSVHYYVSAETLTLDDVKTVEEEQWTEYTGVFAVAALREIVYVRVIDNAGNVRYFTSDGLVYDENASKLTTEVDEAVTGNIYNGDVNIKLYVAEGEFGSGINTITYQVKADGIVTQEETLYSFGYDGSYQEQNWDITGSDVDTENGSYTGIPTLDMLKMFWSGNITVDSKLNNSSNVEVTILVKDNAGNESSQIINLDIDITAPTIDVSYGNNVAQNDKYFNANRVATIVITERTNHFNPVAATAGITITAVDAKGQTVEIDPATMISGWETKEGATPDEATHTATISYTTDANYTFKIGYTDIANNTNESVNTGDSVAPYEFTIDKVNPFGTVTAASAEGRVDTKSELVEKLTFGFWSGSKITVTETHDDVTSVLKPVQYYKTSETKSLTAAELDEVTWTEFEGLEIVPNEQATIYLKITDYAGNYTYISTVGLIVDNTAPREETIAPKITVKPQQPINGFYNGDVKVSVVVTDPIAGDTYAGLRTITYRVLNLGNETQNEVIYEFDYDEKNLPTQEDLKQTWTGEIVVDSEKNNSNDVVIVIYAEDNAGNTSTDQISIKIDTTAPQIDVDYDNDTPDSGSFYKEDRVATIKITERNFDPKDVVITITNTDKVIPSVPVKLADWTKVEGTDPNGDDTTYTAKITYAADGDYTFAIAYTDMAGWTCGNVDGLTYDNEVVFAEGTQNPTAFTIDQTAPVISVAYDNNSAENDKYFKTYRTATITIVEHNFPLNDIERVVFTQAAERGGEIPAVTWTHDGDTHIATFNYSIDGYYTFEVAMTDLAGNASADADYGDTVAGKDFVIDTTFEEMIIQSGVENGVAYGHDDVVIPNIKISDINLQEYTVTLIGVQKDKTIDLTEEVNALLQKGAETVTGILDIFETKQDLDGIYTLTMTSKDKAGNEDSMEIIFTVNRFGSVYIFEDFLLNLVKDGGGFVQSVDGDLVLTEFNADKLVADSLKIEITVDGRPLENVKYTVTPEINDTVAIGSSGWYQYKYTISKDNFAVDGVYKISISSEDATGNTPENSNYEDKGITFRVDSTQAEISSIVGLEKDVINATEVNVKYTVFDSIGIKSITVYVDGQLYETITDFTADLNNYTGTILLKEDTVAQTVRIVVEDMAGNIIDTDDENFAPAYAFNSSVTVSTNIFVRWYAKKFLFWGSIAGVVVLAGIIIFFTAKRKKKDENAK